VFVLLVLAYSKHAFQGLLTDRKWLPVAPFMMIITSYAIVYIIDLLARHQTHSITLIAVMFISLAPFSVSGLNDNPEYYPHYHTIDAATRYVMSQRDFYAPNIATHFATMNLNDEVAFVFFEDYGKRAKPNVVPVIDDTILIYDKVYVIDYWDNYTKERMSFMETHYEKIAEEKNSHVLVYRKREAT
jgi:hypothetical protein